MKKCIVDPEFWELFPEGQIHLLVAKELDNQAVPEKEEYFSKLLKDAALAAQAFLPNENFSQNDVIAQWRQAFTKFKTKKGARSSIESLLKRASQHKEFTPINPLVDIYNSISLTYGVPCGGEDLAAINGDLHLGKAKGGESFRPLGAEKDAPVLPEEIIYYDETGAICRCLNWREAQRTMLTENTKTAVLVVEAVNKQQAERGDQAIKALKAQIDQYFQIESTIIQLTKDHPITELQ
jgi:DNA/RNA-binding domain of Phe-tRNA-synthetase-like protein